MEACTPSRSSGQTSRLGHTSLSVPGVQWDTLRPIWAGAWTYALCIPHTQLENKGWGTRWVSGNSPTHGEENFPPTGEGCPVHPAAPRPLTRARCPCALTFPRTDGRHSTRHLPREITQSLVFRDGGFLGQKKPLSRQAQAKQGIPLCFVRETHGGHLQSWGHRKQGLWRVQLVKRNTHPGQPGQVDLHLPSGPRTEESCASPS